MYSIHTGMEVMYTGMEVMYTGMEVMLCIGGDACILDILPSNAIQIY